MEFSLTYTVGGRTVTSSETENEDYRLEITEDEGGAVFKPEGSVFTMKIIAKHPLTMVKSKVMMPQNLSKGDWIYANGFQSWTDTREYSYDEDLWDIRKVPAFIRDRFHFESYGDAYFYKYKDNETHSFDFGYVRHPDGQAELIGSRNYENAYLIMAYEKDRNRVTARTDCAGKYVDSEFTLFDLILYSGKPVQILRRYFESLGKCEAGPLRGYTSWYRFYQDINEEKMLENLKSIEHSEFDLFQIDDGYETFVGDWLDVDEKKFPSGLLPIVDKIHEKGLLAGLWLAPFVCETKSRVYTEHPDWLYRDADGEPVFAGSNWSGDVVLDVRKEEVREYVRGVLKHYADMGFDFFKLDFLYAAALINEPSGMTRAEIMRDGMKLLRESLKDKQILACGVPLSSAFGMVEYCRIGPDVSLRFDDVFYMRWMHRERISTKVTLQNTVFRSCMDGTVFRCDPDVFLLRDTDIRLNRLQRRALVMLNHLCGSVYMTSDDVGSYDAEKKALLKEARSLSGSVIEDISFDGRIITLLYRRRTDEEGDVLSELKYDTRKGVLTDG
ncbi:MAG: alpha-galactosidase [Lachnospiraceae bacterium]|nr:alpha-galactosidase [Lachnospiraceae bacterium]